MRWQVKMLYLFGLITAIYLLFPLPALADDCAGGTDCGWTAAAAAAVAAAVGAVAGALGISSSPPGAGSGTYGHGMTPEEATRMDPPVQYDPVGQAVLGGVAGMYKEIMTTSAQEIAGHVAEHVMTEVAGHVAGEVDSELVYDKMSESEAGKEAPDPGKSLPPIS